MGFVIENYNLTLLHHHSTLRDKPQRRKLGPDRLKDERGICRVRDNRINGSERYNSFENQQSGDFQSNDGPECMPVPTFPSDIPPLPVLMPVPGVGPLGPFVPAPPEVAMQMFRGEGGPPFEGGARNGRPGPQLGGPAPILLHQAFRQDPQRLRSYQDLDAPDDEVSVIDYRSL